MRCENTTIRKCKRQIAAFGLDADAVFHKSRLILKLYRRVVWALHERTLALQDYAYELGSQSLDAGLCYLSSFAPDTDMHEFEERVCCVMESRMLVEVIERALIRLKNYPDRGEIYFEIITKQFINRFNYTEKEILEVLSIERSVFYDRKKEAIHLFAICLFGYTLPELREEFSTLAEPF